MGLADTGDRGGGTGGESTGGRKRGQRESTEDWQKKKKRSLAVSEIRNRAGRKYTQGLGGWFQSW